MKIIKNITQLTLAIGLAASIHLAQGQPGPGRFGGPGGPPNGGKFPMPPIIKALDTDGDGVIDSNEIANAPAALKTLDKNGDGKLTWEEIMPAPPGGFGGNDGPPPGQQ